jgi:hypothetical protein
LTVFLLLVAPRPAAADPGERLAPVVRPHTATADELYGVVPVGHRSRPPLRVRVWTDRGQDGLYYPGERVQIRFTTNDDAYVCIYDIDTRGQLRVLFPAPGDAGFVHAHEVVSLPGPYADFDYMVTGPPGIETIEAIASRARLAGWEEMRRRDGMNGMMMTGRMRPGAGTTSRGSLRRERPGFWSRVIPSSPFTA